MNIIIPKILFLSIFEIKGLREEGNEELVFNGYSFSLKWWKRSRDEWWWRLHNTEHTKWKMVKLCIFYCNFFKKLNLLPSEPASMGISLATSWKQTRKSWKLWKWVLLGRQWWHPERLVEVQGMSSYLVLQFKCDKPALTCCLPILSSIVSSGQAG